MGMITRVRGRLQSVHTIPKIDPKMRDEKMAETVCLLSILFLLPYCSRGHAPLLFSLGGWCLATYTCVVLPLLISANYKYPARWLRNLIYSFPDLARGASSHLLTVLQIIIAEINYAERFLLTMGNLYAFFCQFFFFNLCDYVMLDTQKQHKSGRMVSSLTTLLLYSIFTYFGTKVKGTFQRSLERQRASRRDFILLIAKIVIEFVKTAIVILCLREQGLQYHFDKYYTTATFLYYIFTDKLFVEGIVCAVRWLQIEKLDSLEHLYVPMLLQFTTAFCSIPLITYLTLNNGTIAMITFATYFTLYLPIKNIIWNYWQPLLLEKETFASFKIASENEITQLDDVCAVCLEQMSKARITPCKHFFHPQCLKRCLQSSMQCPLCKKDFVQNE